MIVTVPVALPEYFDQVLSQVADLRIFDPEQLRRLHSDITVTGRFTRTPLDRLPCDTGLVRRSSSGCCRRDIASPRNDGRA
jgi:hypothetical protein